MNETETHLWLRKTGLATENTFSRVSEAGWVIERVLETRWMSFGILTDNRNGLYNDACMNEV